MVSDVARDRLDSRGLDGLHRSAGNVERREEGLAHLVRVLDPDDTAQLRYLASRLKESGRFDETYEFDLRAAEQGRPDAMSGVAQWLEIRGRHSEALQEYQRAVRAIGRAHAGRHLSVWAIAALLERRMGRTRTSALRRARSDEPAVHLLRRERGVDATEEWLLRQAEAGYPAALGRAVEFLASQGTAEKAERLRRYGIQPGGLIAAPWSPPVLDMEALDQSFPPDVPGPHDQTAAHPAVVGVLPGIVEDRAPWCPAAGARCRAPSARPVSDSYSSSQTSSIRIVASSVWRTRKWDIPRAS